MVSCCVLCRVVSCVVSYGVVLYGVVSCHVVGQSTQDQSKNIIYLLYCKTFSSFKQETQRVLQCITRKYLLKQQVDKTIGMMLFNDAIIIIFRSEYARYLAQCCSMTQVRFFFNTDYSIIQLFSYWAGQGSILAARVPAALRCHFVGHSPNQKLVSLLCMHHP